MDSLESLLDYPKQRDSEFYTGSFALDPKHIQMQELAKKYHDECDSYDNAVCTGFCHRTNTKMPVTAYQSRLVSMNALLVLKKVYTEAQEHGICVQELRQAISSFRR